MPLPAMNGDYYDPDTNPRVFGAYDPCARGILLTFDPVPGGPPVKASLTPIGSVNEIRFVLSVSSNMGSNNSAILTKERVARPSIDSFFYQVHNLVDVFQGDVTVRAEMVDNVTHVFIEP